MRTLKAFLALVSVLIALPALGQYSPIAKGVSVNPTNSVLLGPLDLFKANSNRIWEVIGITNLDSLGKATNGFLVSPTATNGTWKGATVIPSGASVTGAPGAAIGFDKVTISGTPTDPTDATTQGVVDSLGNIVFLVVPPTIVNNLAGMVAAPVGSISRFCFVRNSTAGDGAAGLWIFDPASVVAEGPVAKKSGNLSPSDPGRWLKLY